MHHQCTSSHPSLLVLPFFLLSGFVGGCVGAVVWRGGGEEYAVIPWEDMWEEVDAMTAGKNNCVPEHARCWLNSSVITPSPSPPHSSKNICKQCQCDTECVEYGDCCWDRAQADWGDGREEGSGRYSCRKMNNENIVGLLMVDSCPSKYAGTPVQRLCTQQVPQELYSYVLDLPVTSSVSNITYVNYHCAACHHDASDLYAWNITINCKTRQILKEYTMVEFMRKAQYLPDLRQFRRYTYRTPEDELHNIHQESHICVLEVLEFIDSDDFVAKYGGRVCPYPKSTCDPRFKGRRPQCQEMIRQCDPAWPDHLDVEKCRRYSQVMVTNNGVRQTFYKNPHCARCNYVNVSSNQFYCAPHEETCKLIRRPTPRFPPCFSVLMDFSHDSCNAHDELWDPIHLSCKKIFCGQLYMLVDGKCVRNLTQYAVLENSTLLDHSCPKVRLLPSDYIPLENGSVLVNTTRKLYEEGEYEMLGGEMILICNEHILYFAGFTEIHELLTFVVLVISLVALGLHIIIFLLVPRHRNLPGQNLFSLTCCLFIAHLLFLTGTRATSNHSLCVFLSATLHFFWLASFCWMNVMSVDVCRTFTGQMHHGGSTGYRTYVFYSLYAWSVPTLVVGLALIFDYVDLLQDYQVEYGTDICWINNHLGLALFFLLPQGAIVLENTVLFCLTACAIYKQAKDAKYANIHSQSFKKNVKMQGFKNNPVQPQQGGRQRKDRVRLILYMKLGLIQGLSWITGFVAAFANVPACWYPFTILNGLQGAFIFLAFDMKTKVWESVWEALMGRPWTKRQSSKETRMTSAGPNYNTSNNRSSKSCSDSEGENRVGSERGHRAWREGSTGQKLAEEGALQSAVKASPASLTGRKQGTTKDHEVGIRNGDLRASVVRGKFDSEGGEETTKGSLAKPIGLRQRPDLQRVVELLAQLQQTRGDVDLPDLVQQLILRRGTRTQVERGQQWREGQVDGVEGVGMECVQRSARTLAKCRSFTEGTDPQLQEDQRRALSARLKVVEYWRENPSLQDLLASPALPSSPPSSHRTPHHRPRSSIISTPTQSHSNSLHSSQHHLPPHTYTEAPTTSPHSRTDPHTYTDMPTAKHTYTDVPITPHNFPPPHTDQAVPNQRKIRRTAEPLRPVLPKSQSFSQISEVAVAAALLQRAAGLDERRPTAGREEVTTPASESLV